MLFRSGAVDALESGEKLPLLRRLEQLRQERVGPGLDALLGGDRLVRYDLTDGSAVERGFDGGRPGEAVFVPAADSSDESDGWYLAYIYDPARNGSDLVILDASDFTGDAVATIHLPQRVPYGFHGNWITGHS